MCDIASVMGVSRNFPYYRRTISSPKRTERRHGLLDPSSSSTHEWTIGPPIVLLSYRTLYLPCDQRLAQGIRIQLHQDLSNPYRVMRWAISRPTCIPPTLPCRKSTINEYVHQFLEQLPSNDMLTKPSRTDCRIAVSETLFLNGLHCGTPTSNAKA